MRKFISLILSISMFSSVAFAECDFATMVKKLDDGTFAYSKECHLKNGENSRDLGIATKQVDLLNKAVDLKDQAIKKADERAELWKDTAIKQDERLTTIESMQSTNKWLYFGLGIVTMFGATYAASQLKN